MAYILLGLRWSAELAAHLFRGVVSMEESATYQAILQEGVEKGIAMGESRGAVAEAKKLLRRLGDAAFGPPDARTAARIEGLGDLAQLEDLVARTHTVSSWQELLGEPRPGRRDSRR
jgi:hypothetical protein